MPLTKCWRFPTPPEAITGIETESLTARVSSVIKSGFRSVAVHAGEKNFCRRRAFQLSLPTQPHQCLSAFCRRGYKPPRAVASALSINGNHNGLTAVNRRGRQSNRGLLTPAELIETLSAPAFNKRRTSSALRTPPADGQRNTKRPEPQRLQSL